MKKLKVAIVSPYPPGKGTLNEYAFHLIKHFREKAEVQEIILITEKLPEGLSYEFEDAPVPVKVKDVWSFNSLKNIYNIWKAVRETKPDVVLYNIHFLSFGDKKIPAALGLMSPALSRLSGFPSIALLHNIVESVDLSSAGITKIPFLAVIYRIFGTILTRILLASDMLGVTISKYVQILEEKYKTSKVALVPHGSFELPPLPEFNSSGESMKVMAFGKFGTYKKVENLIEAAEMVRKRSGKDIEVVIAGTDSPNSMGYLDSVKNKYRHLQNITFTGYVEEEDVPTIFGESDVVVFPYTSTTGSSGVLHQAGSYGKACILPIIGDLQSLIEEEGYSGYYFEPDSVTSLADAIQQSLEKEHERIAMAKNNYAAAASLPMSDIADWYLLHFNRVIFRENEKFIPGAVNTSEQLQPQLSIVREVSEIA